MTGSYGSTDLAVSLPSSPAFASVTQESCCQRPRYRTDAHAADESSFYRALEETTDAIKDFTVSGFELGSSADTSSATSHFFVAFESTVPAAIPPLPAVLLTLPAVVMGGVGLRSQLRSP